MASLKEIQEFLENISKTDIQKIKLKTADIDLSAQLKPEIKITNTPQNITPQVSFQQPVQNTKSEQPVLKEIEKNEDDGLITVKSPMVGTFYRKPAPDKPAFAEVGQKIKVGDVICIIEAMKLFNEIESEIEGEIVKILVEDSAPVEFDQPLFLVKQ